MPVTTSIRKLQHRIKQHTRMAYAGTVPQRPASNRSHAHSRVVVTVLAPFAAHQRRPANRRQGSSSTVSEGGSAPPASSTILGNHYGRRRYHPMPAMPCAPDRYCRHPNAISREHSAGCAAGNSSTTPQAVHAHRSQCKPPGCQHLDVGQPLLYRRRRVTSTHRNAREGTQRRARPVQRQPCLRHAQAWPPLRQTVRRQCVADQHPMCSCIHTRFRRPQRRHKRRHIS